MTNEQRKTVEEHATAKQTWEHLDQVLIHLIYVAAAAARGVWGAGTGMAIALIHDAALNLADVKELLRQELEE